MAPTLRQALIYLPNVFLGLQLIYSGFSRFTEGRYTPAYHAWQRAHQSPDSFESESNLFNRMIVPSMDTAVGLILLFASPRTAFKGAALTTAFMCFGLTLMVQNGQDWTWDLITLLSAVAAAYTSRMRQT